MLKGAIIYFYCLFDESFQTFALSNTCNRMYRCTELNWLCKHIKKVRSSQAAILVLNWVKHSFPLCVSSRLYKAQTGQKTEKLSWYIKNFEGKEKEKCSAEETDWYIMYQYFNTVAEKHVLSEWQNSS